MKRNLIIAGSTGALGSGVLSVLLNKEFDKIYLIDRKLNAKFTSEKVIPFEVNDFNNELNLSKIFSTISTDKETIFYLFSTVGGYFGGKKIWETDLSEFEAMIKSNLNTSFLLAKYFSLLVKESLGGSICFTSSYSSFNPEKEKSAYNISKNGLNFLIESLMLEGKKINLSANGIAPFIIDTPENREWVKPEDYETLIKPEEVGNFLNDFLKHVHFLNGNIVSLPFRLPFKR